MAADFDNVTAGPAQLLIDDAEIGHTEGGIQATLTPKQRMRSVDQFGMSEVAIIHQGDTARITTPFCEWTAATLKEVYSPGNDETDAVGTKYMGFGRASGFLYPDKDIKIIPLMEADEDKRLQFFRCSPIGELKLMHNSEADRIFELEYAALVDEDQTDGELIGKIFLEIAGT
jgi:hypothetical protein